MKNKTVLVVGDRLTHKTRAIGMTRIELPLVTMENDEPSEFMKILSKKEWHSNEDDIFSKAKGDDICSCGNLTPEFVSKNFYTEKELRIAFDEMKKIFEDKPKTFIYHAIDKNGFNVYGEVKQTELEQFTKTHKIIKLI